MNTLDNIKATLLTRCPSYHQGFANVSKPDGTELILSEENNNYVGISDNLGNYFYLRQMKTASYSIAKMSARVQFYEARTQCRIISVYHNGNDDTILQILINAVSLNGGIVTNSNTEKTAVIKAETGKAAANINLNKLSIVSVDFDVIEIINSKNCELNPCNC